LKGCIVFGWTASKPLLPKECGIADKTTTVWNKGFMNSAPKISRDKKWWGWLTNNGDDFSRTDLVIAPYGKNDPYMTIKWAQTSWDFSADSRKVYCIKAYETSDNGSFLNDLYVADLTTKSERRLTRGGRIYDVAACPDDQTIACVQYRNGAFSIITAGNKWLLLADARPRRDWQAIFRVVIFSCQDNGCAHNGTAGLFRAKDSAAADSAKNTVAQTPEYMLATTRCVNGKGTVCIVGTESRKLSMIGTGAAQEENPHWSKDGRIYFDADYDGTFNIYSVKVDGSGLSRHTDAPFGILYPFTDDNNTMLCASYAGQEFSIASCELASGAQYAVPKQYACSFSDLPRPKGT